MTWLDWRPSSLASLFSSSVSFLAALICALVISGIIARSKWLRFRHLPFPPGPSATSWVSGHFSLMPKTHQWEEYTEWAKTHGPVMYFRVFHQRFIMVSSHEDCSELFEKRSTLYSNRPVIPMANLMGWDFAAALMPWGARWRRQRRLFQKTFKKDVTVEYRPEQTRKVNDMLLALLEDPTDFRTHIKAVTAATIMSITYGYDIQSKADPFVNLIDTAVEFVTHAFLPGAAIVNVFPILRFLPSWLPGTGFKRYIIDGRKLTDRMKDEPFKFVQDNIKAGLKIPSLIGDNLSVCQNAEELEDLRDYAPMVYGAGVDTTGGTLETFFLAMATNPDVQKKAQEEIDINIGHDRLPSFDDWPSLPYIDAVVREALRWKPVLPLSVPRCPVDDDIYNGYFIPKGTILIPNVWALTRDETRYKNPDDFDPSRFFDQNGDLIEDDVDYVFGFGRRECPGRYMARAQIFIVIARVLSTFNISPAKDASGNEIPIPGEYTSGLLAHPLEHPCAITPRSERAVRLLKEVVAETKDRK